MKKITIVIMICVSFSILIASGNDLGADSDSGNKDTFYYCGNKKIKLHYDPTTVIIFDFSGASNIDESKSAIYKLYPKIKYNRHLRLAKGFEEGRKTYVTVYDVTEGYIQSNLNNPHLKIMDCYYTEDGLKVQPDGLIDVTLNTMEDFKILDYYIDYFKLKSIYTYGEDSLSHVLGITPETCMNPIEISNILHETKKFVDVSPIFTCKASEIAYDTNILEQWGLYNSSYMGIDISASKAWGYATGSGIRVAIIDGAVDVNHKDLKENISKDRYDATSDKKVLTFDNANFHGTHCAGIVGAIRNNNIQVCGVAPDSEIVPIRVEVDEQDFPIHANRAIEWAWKNDVDVISISWGCTENSKIKNAINNALSKGRDGKGCVVVTSAGNNGNGNGNISFPGNFNHEVITVGAIMNNGKRYSASSYGDYMFVCAPGYEILSTVPDNKIEKASGTSMAAPHVAGVAALILERDSTLTAKQVREIIAKNTTDINPDDNRVTKEFDSKWDKEYGYGLVNAYECVRNTPRKW